MKKLFGLLLVLLMVAAAFGEIVDSELEEDSALVPVAPSEDEPQVSPPPDTLLPLRPSNSDEPQATCSSAKSCGRCISGDHGRCGWCGEHGDVGRCYECVMVGGECVGSKDAACAHPWNARVCPGNRHGHTSRHLGLSMWAIIGITVGAGTACAFVCCSLCCWLFLRRRRQYERQEYGYIVV